MKKICLLKFNFNTVGGTEMVTVKLANELVNDYEVHVLSIATQGAMPEQFQFDSRVVYHNLFDQEGRVRQLLLPASKKIKGYLIDNAIDVVFSIGVHSHAFMVLGSKGTGVKTVACDHMTVQNDYGNKSYALQRWVGAKFADKVVALTQENVQAYQDKYHTPKDRLTAIYNWIDEKEAVAPYQADAKQIVTVGRLATAKGYDYLMPVAKAVLTKHPDWTWHICGAGDQGIKEQLETFIAENHLEGRLVLRGNVADMTPVYEASAIYVMTSRYEGLPLVLLEAKQHHLPIVSFNCPTGPSEIVRDGENGYLIQDFDSDDMSRKLNRLIEDQDLRQQFSEKSYFDIEKFSKEKILQQWKDLIKELTNEH